MTNKSWRDQIVGLCLKNTCFQKRKSHLITTFRSGETEAMVDYILVNNKYRSSVKDVKVILGEFTEGVNNKCDNNEDWCDLKRKLLDVASEVCGYTKGKPRDFER